MADDKAIAGPSSTFADDTSVVSLVARANAHDVAAFALLYERFVDPVYRYILFRVHDPHLASDLTQDVFESMLRGLGRLESAEKLVGWLFGIAHHKVVTHWRKARRQQTTEVTIDLNADDDLAAIELGIDAARLMVAASALNQAQQDVLALRFVTGLSVQEAAAALGRSEDGLKKLQRRALTNLRQRVAARSEVVDR